MSFFNLGTKKSKELINLFRKMEVSINIMKEHIYKTNKLI